MTADPPTPRRVHLARLVSPTGAVSPACAKRPHAINMQRDTWSTDSAAVTCQGCLKTAADRATPRCQNKHWRTRKRDCPHPARYVVRAAYDELLVCGVHRRGWIPRVVHPLGSAQLATPP